MVLLETPDRLQLDLYALARLPALGCETHKASLFFQLWQCIMKSVEWNKKEELVAEQALKYLKVWGEKIMNYLY